MFEILTREQLEQYKQNIFAKGKSILNFGDILNALDTALYYKDRCEQLENDKINADMNLEHLTGLVERQAAMLRRAKFDIRNYWECACIDYAECPRCHLLSKLDAAIKAIDNLDKGEGK